MGILKLIDWTDDTKNTIVHKIDLEKSNDTINKGSKLTVREGQAAVFCHKGKMADVFLPGFYTLSTDNVPVLTKLMSWKYGFERPFKSDIYFVNTRQFTDQKWGTMNPIIVRDADYGAVRIRAFGTYAFRVTDPYVSQKHSGHPHFRRHRRVQDTRSRHGEQPRRNGRYGAHAARTDV